VYPVLIIIGTGNQGLFTSLFTYAVLCIVTKQIQLSNVCGYDTRLIGMD